MKKVFIIFAAVLALVILCHNFGQSPVIFAADTQVTLTSSFNIDGFSYDTNRNDGNYGCVANAHTNYSADLINTNPSFDGTTYKLGSMTNGALNAIKGTGQTITLTQGQYSAIRFLGSATNGDKTGTFRINYTDGTYTDTSVTEKDWCTSNTTGQKVVQTMAQRHDNGVDQAVNCYVYAYYLAPTAGKTVSSLGLPNNQDIKVLAITLVSGPTSTPTPTGTPTPTPTLAPGDEIDRTDEGGVITASVGGSPVGEEKEKAFDNSIDTKWLINQASGWIQFQFNNSRRYAVTKYAIMSANDEPDRDPLNWTVKGSNDGSAWTTLETRTGEDFAARKLKRIFTFTNTIAYGYYRLDMSNNAGTILQLAEIQLFECGPALTWMLGPFTKQDSVNPCITPRPDTYFYCPVKAANVYWEAAHVYNPAAVVRNGAINIIYRAQDTALTSRIGRATSTDGTSFTRNGTPVFYPNNDSMKTYEWPGGCEDPRIVEDTGGTYYMTYTAYDGGTARLAVATSTDLINWTKQGLAFKNAYGGKYINTWSKSGSIVCDLVGSRLVAKLINGKYWMYWGESYIYIATSTNLIDWTPLEDAGGNRRYAFTTRSGYFDSALVEPGPPAIYTANGIVFIYNSKNASGSGGDPYLAAGTYAAGQALLNGQDPSQLLDRTKTYFLYPERSFEVSGLVNYVCFLEGLVFYNNKWFLYYGTADSKIAVATTP
jgi:predicted GH43/DUF377 family glycosyl hydrolase